jgi:hypothetical protein
VGDESVLRIHHLPAGKKGVPAPQDKIARRGADHPSLIDVPPSNPLDRLDPAEFIVFEHSKEFLFVVHRVLLGLGWP